MKSFFKEVGLLVPLIVVMLASAALADSIGFYEADSSHNWEQNSDRPINIRYTPSSARHIVGIDAWVDYELNKFVYVTNTRPIVSGDYMSSSWFDVSSINATFSEGKVQYAKGVATSGTGWDVSSATDIYQLTFRITPTATGTALLSWEPDTCRLSTGPGVYVIHNGLGIGTINDQTINIAASHSPVGFAGVGGVTDAQTGNKINVSWTTAGVTDYTPFGITATSYNSNNVRYKVYRSTTGSGTGTLIAGGDFSISGGSYPNGLSTGIQGGFPDDLIDYTTGNPVSYYYRVEAVDNTLDHNETSTPWSSAVKSHDYTPCASPSFSAKNVSDISVNGNQPRMFHYNGSSWDTITGFTGYVPENDKVTLYWNKGSASDYAGCMVLQNPSSTWTGITPVGAAGDSNGNNYGVGGTVNTATVVATGDIGSTVVSSLTPGSEYFFNVYNYDRCAYDGYPNEQGRNYAAASPIIADAGIPPHNASNVFGSNTSAGVKVNWTNPSDSWFDGVIIVAKLGSYPTTPGDTGVGGAIYEERGLTPGATNQTYTFDTSVFPDPLLGYYVTIFTHNNTGTDKTLRRYSSGAQASYDTSPPDPVSFLYAMPATDTSLRLNWFDPSSSNLGGVIILRKPGTSEFTSATCPFASGTLPTLGVPVNVDEVPIYIQSAMIDSTESFSDTGLTKGQQYYYRAWAYSQSIVYSNNYDSTGSVPGGGIGGGGGGFVGSTQIIPGWNLIASGQAASILLNNSNLLESGAQSGDLLSADVVYQLIPGTTNYNKAYLSLSGSWIDVSTGIAPTWQMSADRGYFYKRKSASPFSWGTRPKP